MNYLVAICSQDAALRSELNDFLVPAYTVETYPSFTALGESIRDGMAPDVVLLDVAEGHLSATDSSRGRALLGAVPVVAMAREFTPACLHNSLAVGATDVVFSPLSRDRLLACISRILRPLEEKQINGRAQTAVLPGFARVLLVCAQPERTESLSSALGRLLLSVDSVPDESAALARANHASYRVVVHDTTEAARAEALIEGFRCEPGMGKIPFLVLLGQGDPSPLVAMQNVLVRRPEGNAEITAQAVGQLISSVRIERVFTRYNAQFSAELRCAGLSVPAQVVNLSRGGVLLRCSQLPPLDAYVAGSLAIARGEAPIEIRGRITRASTPALSSLVEVAVEFLGLTADNEARLIALVRALAGRGAATL